MAHIDDTADEMLALFRSGKDTAHIARIYKIPEAKVSFLIFVARSRALGKPAIYHGRDRQLKRVGPKAAA